MWGGLQTLSSSPSTMLCTRPPYGAPPYTIWHPPTVLCTPVRTMICTPALHPCRPITLALLSHFLPSHCPAVVVVLCAPLPAVPLPCVSLPAPSVPLPCMPRRSSIARRT